MKEYRVIDTVGVPNMSAQINANALEGFAVISSFTVYNDRYGTCIIVIMERESVPPMEIFESEKEI